MKTRISKVAVAILFLFAVSCDEPETVVTNIIHTDGSVTRRIVMRNGSADFSTNKLQVPFDSTWTVTDSIEINENNDSTWIRKAEKHFMNIAEVNALYKADSGINRGTSRYAVIEKKFVWFNTSFRFSENIDRKLSAGYPVTDFLNPEELKYFYAPAFLTNEWDNGPDSLKYKSLNDSISKKTDKWAMKTIMSEFILQFEKLAQGKGASPVIDGLKSREDELVGLIGKKYMNDFDSLWEEGVILKDFIGEENALKYRVEADSAVNLAMSNFLIDFNDYSVKIVMPGRLTGTNGYIDSNKVLIWPVKSDYFITQPYEMWAESKVPNSWAWIVTGIFLLFVLSGIIVRAIKKG